MKTALPLFLGLLISCPAFAQTTTPLTTEPPPPIPLTNSAVNGVEDMFSLSGTLALTSNYIASGVSQTDNDPALQGSFNALTKYGIYGEVWASTVNFPNGYGNTAYLESDWSIGYQNQYQDLSYDFGYVYYFYPGSVELDYGEIFLDLGYNIFNAEIKYTPNASNEGENGVYVEGGATVPILPKYAFGLKDLEVGGTLGYSWYSGNLSTEDYVNWELFLQKTWHERMVTQLAYTDTEGETGTPDHLDGAKISGTITLLLF